VSSTYLEPEGPSAGRRL